MLSAAGLLAVLLAGPARAELLVTRAWARPVAAGEAPVAARADLELNRTLVLKDVELLEGEGQESAFRLPASGSGKQDYADIRVLSKSLFDQILSVFRSRRYIANPAPAASDVYFNVAAPRRSGDAARPASVDVVFRGELLVTFGVLRQGRSLSVAYPSRREGGRSKPLFQITDSALRWKVETSILSRAQEAGVL